MREENRLSMFAADNLPTDVGRSGVAFQDEAEFLLRTVVNPNPAGNDAKRRILAGRYPLTPTAGCSRQQFSRTSRPPSGRSPKEQTPAL
jgi:hypothetical protein